MRSANVAMSENTLRVVFMLRMSYLYDQNEHNFTLQGKEQRERKIGRVGEGKERRKKGNVVVLDNRSRDVGRGWCSYRLSQ